MACPKAVQNVERPLSGPPSVNITAVAAAEPEPRDHWFIRNADWPALLLNVVVLALAIYGVVQARQANTRAKELERKAFRESRFLPLGSHLQLPRTELEVSANLLDGVLSVPNAPSFDQEIDALGPMLMPALMRYSQRLADIDSDGSFGSGWEGALRPYRDAVEASFDIANDQTKAVADREQATQMMSTQLRTGLDAMTRFEFERRQEWSKPFF